MGGRFKKEGNLDLIMGTDQAHVWPHVGWAQRLYRHLQPYVHTDSGSWLSLRTSTMLEPAILQNCDTRRASRASGKADSIESLLHAG